MDAEEQAFKEWWYDYHIKQGITNTPKHTDLARAVWKAARSRPILAGTQVVVPIRMWEELASKLAWPPHGTALVPLEPPASIPEHHAEFDEQLFDLCREDDYRGLYRAMVTRAALSSSPAEAIKYERVPSLDKRILKGDDFAGDAWVRWVAVGHTPGSSAPSPILKVAADLLRFNAGLVRESHTGGTEGLDWSEEPEAEADYRELISTAQALDPFDEAVWWKDFVAQRDGELRG